MRIGRTPPPAPPDVGDALEHGQLTARHVRDQTLDADAEALAGAGFDAAGVRPFAAGPTARLLVRLPAGQTMLGLQLRVGADMTAGPRGTIDLVLRNAAGKPEGGLAIDLTVAD